MRTERGDAAATFSVLALAALAALACGPATAAAAGHAKKSSGGALGLIVALLVLVLAFGGRLLIARRVRASRRRTAAAGGTEPAADRGTAHGPVAGAVELRASVERSLAELAARRDRAPTPRTEEGAAVQQRALSRLEAARVALQRGDDLHDLVGAQLLAEEAGTLMRQASAIEHGRRPAEPPRPCFFDPRHGRSAREVGWRDGRQVPACAACAADLDAGRQPPALPGGDRPWFEGDDLWARTGYGLWSDDLAARILSGER